MRYRVIKKTRKDGGRKKNMIGRSSCLGRKGGRKVGLVGGRRYLGREGEGVRGSEGST